MTYVNNVRGIRMSKKVDVEKNKNNIIDILERVDRNTDKVIEWLKNSDYFDSPASSKYHLNVPGGLAQHSYNVGSILIQMNKMFNMKYNEDSLWIIGLLHDVCKVHTYEPNILKSGGLGKVPYKKIDELPLGHGDKSLIILSGLIDLTTDEQLAIRWHMGTYDPAFRMNQSAAELASKYVVFTHVADMFASRYVDTEYTGDFE
jgi:hypothetical protein